MRSLSSPRVELSLTLNKPLALFRQAKKGLHPLLYRITVVGTKGGTFPLLSAVKHKGDSYFLQHDHDTHVAWTGKHVAAAATGQVAKFKRRFDFLYAANAVIGKKKGK